MRVFALSFRQYVRLLICDDTFDVFLVYYMSRALSILSFPKINHFSQPDSHSSSHLPVSPSHSPLKLVCDQSHYY